MTPENHEDCAGWMKAQFLELGADVTVSTVPPPIKTVYEQDPFVCPHGTVFYHEPTSEQIAEWARDGVR
ncbi:MAG: hypothetical protein V4515_12660 [Chloroflexota bacterium]